MKWVTREKALTLAYPPAGRPENPTAEDRVSVADRSVHRQGTDISVRAGG